MYASAIAILEDVRAQLEAAKPALPAPVAAALKKAGFKEVSGSTSRGGYGGDYVLHKGAIKVKVSGYSTGAGKGASVSILAE